MLQPYHHTRAAGAGHLFFPDHGHGPARPRPGTEPHPGNGERPPRALVVPDHQHPGRALGQGAQLRQACRGHGLAGQPVVLTHAAAPALPLPGKVHRPAVGHHPPATHIRHRKVLVQDRGPPRTEHPGLLQTRRQRVIHPREHQVRGRPGEPQIRFRLDEVARGRVDRVIGVTAGRQCPRRQWRVDHQPGPARADPGRRQRLVDGRVREGGDVPLAPGSGERISDSHRPPCIVLVGPQILPVSADHSRRLNPSPITAGLKRRQLPLQGPRGRGQSLVQAAGVRRERPQAHRTRRGRPAPVPAARRRCLPGPRRGMGRGERRGIPRLGVRPLFLTEEPITGLLEPVTVVMLPDPLVVPLPPGVLFTPGLDHLPDIPGHRPQRRRQRVRIIFRRGGISREKLREVPPKVLPRRGNKRRPRTRTLLKPRRRRLKRRPHRPGHGIVKPPAIRSIRIRQQRHLNESGHNQSPPKEQN